MDRRAFIGTVASVMVVPTLIARAQTAPASRRIGFLGPGAPPSRAELDRIYAPLEKLGWVEGRNLHFERRYAGGKAELLGPLAEELVRLKVDLIVTGGTDATVAAKNATESIPIIFRSAGDPIRTGLVASLAHPGGNVTGYAIVGPELDAKRLALLRELLPSVQRVVYLENSKNPYYRAARKDLEQAYRTLAIQPIFVEVAAASELEKAVEKSAAHGQALLVPEDALFYDNRGAILSIALKYSLPIMVERRIVRELGALVSYQDTQGEQDRRSAAFIDKVLRGAKPADLPVEQPTVFELIINLNTARALRLTISQSLLMRAEVVQ